MNKSRKRDVFTADMLLGAAIAVACVVLIVRDKCENMANAAKRFRGWLRGE